MSFQTRFWGREKGVRGRRFKSVNKGKREKREKRCFPPFPLREG